MPNPDEVPSPRDPVRETGARKPPKASTTAQIVRESDRMRAGIEAAVLDVAMPSLTLRTCGSFAVEEPLKIHLKNVVQRFEKEARGVVRTVHAGEDGSTTIGIELLTRLSALEVSLLKMGIHSGPGESETRWV
jgi:hypothetical protein